MILHTDPCIGKSVPNARVQQQALRLGYNVQKLLPAAKSGGEPLPEGLLWLLLTGEVCHCRHTVHVAMHRLNEEAKQQQHDKPLAVCIS